MAQPAPTSDLVSVVFSLLRVGTSHVSRVLLVASALASTVARRGWVHVERDGVYWRRETMAEVFDEGINRRRSKEADWLPSLVLDTYPAYCSRAGRHGDFPKVTPRGPFL